MKKVIYIFFVTKAILKIKITVIENRLKKCLSSYFI